MTSVHRRLLSFYLALRNQLNPASASEYNFIERSIPRVHMSISSPLKCPVTLVKTSTFSGWDHCSSETLGALPSRNGTNSAENPYDITGAASAEPCSREGCARYVPQCSFTQPLGGDRQRHMAVLLYRHPSYLTATGPGGLAR